MQMPLQTGEHAMATRKVDLFGELASGCGTYGIEPGLVRWGSDRRLVRQAVASGDAGLQRHDFSVEVGPCRLHACRTSTC